MCSVVLCCCVLAEYTIMHTLQSYTLTDKNSLFTHTTTVSLDWQPCESKSPDGKETSILRARMQFSNSNNSNSNNGNSNGRLVLHVEAELPNGKRSVEERGLESRTVLKQTVEVFDKDV